MFTSREIAVGIWTVAFAVWALSRAEIRKSLLGLFRSFFRLKVLASVGLMASYTIAIVWLLAMVGMWHWGLTKDTILWFFLSAFVSVMEHVTAKDDENVLVRIASDNLKVVLIVEFLVSTYTFPLPIELVLQPFLFLLVAADAIAQREVEFAKVAQLTGTVLCVLGLGVFSYSLAVAIADWKNLLSIENMRGVLAVSTLKRNSAFKCSR